MNILKICTGSILLATVLFFILVMNIETSVAQNYTPIETYTPITYTETCLKKLEELSDYNDERIALMEAHFGKTL